MRSWKRLVMAMAGVALLIGCGGTSSTGGSAAAPSAAPAKQMKIGLALAGPKNDHSFYQAYFDGVTEAAKKYNAKVSVVESLEDPQKIVDALKNLATDNDLVVGGGAALVPAANSIAAQYPNVQFVMSGKVADAPNLHGYAIRWGVASYVAGVVATKWTKSKKVGYIGGAPVPPTTQAETDFKAAVTTDPSIQYSSTIVGSYSDAGKAKAAAQAMIANGVDVIYAFVDSGLTGVIQAVDESGKDVKIVNQTSDRCSESKHIVGYSFQNSQILAETLVKDYSAKTLVTGTKLYGLDDLSIQHFGLCPGNEAQKTLVDDTTAKVQKGQVSLPV